MALIQTAWADIIDEETDERARQRVAAGRAVSGKEEEEEARADPRGDDASGTRRLERGCRHTEERRRGGWNHKKQCQYYINIDATSAFGVRQRLLGPRGQNVKDINERTGARLRLRGKGSGFREGVRRQESEDPLMLCLSVNGRDAYEAAKVEVSELLSRIYRDFNLYCQLTQGCSSNLHVRLHEGYRTKQRLPS